MSVWLGLCVLKGILLSCSYISFFTQQDTAGKYRQLADKKCHHVPKPAVELQRHCLLKECPVRTTPALHRWSTYHHTFSQPLPHPPPPAEWSSSPWSQVCWHNARTDSRTAAFTVSSLHSPQCTVTCGGGVQTRTVQCLVQGKPSPSCAFHLKPLMSQACNTNFCPQPDKKGTVTLLSLSKREANLNQAEQS